MLYELHVGTFTPEGTLDSAIGRLDHLVDLGVGIVELMPVNSFDGTHNWGYDGVGWFAVDETYGGPAAYQRFVDACHAAGIGVIQDVVHNHLGPSGNYLPRFGPYLKTGRNTWGDLVNLDGEGSAEVRRYILDNVRMWLEDYHVDGLRLDAVHALQDSSPVHLLEEMAAEVDELSTRLGRPLTLIAESDLNDPRLITPREAGGYGLHAQWSDDFHHALHVALTGETHGYYADFAPLAALAKVCERGFFHDGTWSSFREREHGAPIDPDVVPPWRLVVCSQNHDQVGNRAAGDRLTEALDDDQLACAALVTLCSPVHPDAVPGRGVGGLDAVPVLHQPHRPGGRPGHLRGPAHRVRAARLGPRRPFPTRRTRRRTSAPSSTGRSATRVAGSGCSMSTAGSQRCGASTPTSPSRRSRLLGRRGDPGLHHASRRPDRRGQLRRARADRRVGGRRAALRDRVRCRPARRLGHPPAARGLPVTAARLRPVRAS